MSNTDDDPLTALKEPLLTATKAFQRPDTGDAGGASQSNNDNKGVFLEEPKRIIHEREFDHVDSFPSEPHELDIADELEDEGHIREYMQRYKKKSAADATTQGEVLSPRVGDADQRLTPSSDPAESSPADPPPETLVSSILGTDGSGLSAVEMPKGKISERAAGSSASLSAQDTLGVSPYFPTNWRASRLGMSPPMSSGLPSDLPSSPSTTIGIDAGSGSKARDELLSYQLSRKHEREQQHKRGPTWRRYLSSLSFGGHEEEKSSRIARRSASMELTSLMVETQERRKGRDTNDVGAPSAAGKVAPDTAGLGLDLSTRPGVLGAGKDPMYNRGGVFGEYVHDPMSLYRGGAGQDTSLPRMVSFRPPPRVLRAEIGRGAFRAHRCHRPRRGRHGHRRDGAP